MSDTTKNLGGRPEIGGRIGPVSYGDELLDEIDRQAAGAGQSRAQWLRDATLERVNRTAPETLDWQQMTEAGIDIGLVERREYGYAAQTWQATSPDGLTRVIFGCSTADTEHVIPDGQHKGWDIGWYELVDEEGNGEIQESYTSGDYYEPFDWRSMLADVAKVAPLSDVDRVLAALNDYEGENIWDELRISLDYDEAATNEVEHGSGEDVVIGGTHYTCRSGEWAVA